MDDRVQYADVLIIGAGISGIGAAYRLQEKNPNLSYAVLERRARIGGTWDLHRYPGIRSDSDIFTLSYPFEPWTRPENVADGPDIREYLTQTARKHGIDKHIRFNTHVLAADWDSTTDTWTVQTEQDGTPTTYRGRFLFFGTGYYNYDEPYRPDFPGLDEFSGEVVHPQHWPESLDYAGKRIVVIGSGATAVSMIPSLTETAGHVTMLQRSPTYMLSGPRVNPVVQAIRAVLPGRAGYWGARIYNTIFTVFIYAFARAAPKLSRRFIRRNAKRNLPADYPVDVHFNPRYDPWDQRLCAMLDNDFYEAINNGRLDVVTDHIDHIDASGIVLRSGQRIDADVIITATGIQLQALGGVHLSIDGDEIKPQDRFVYKEHMLEDVPNLAWCVGYINASWTLRADLTARAFARLVSYMDSHGYTHAYPHLGDKPMPEKPAWNINAGYVQRAAHALPKSGTHRPWNVRHNYVLDAIDHRFDRIEESMVFGRAPVPATPVA
ncbi:FAD-dependent oxidoreductase [Mycolicibacterium celeriflavum]|uniref:Monooxygenase flavin-binding family protein n=1 Tax=Mycolicibacterium celeriflavum TaxID=1249101 RepID=A0A1X0BM56_MYCCF|nr:NAD(P)/FAD-dependent oxidoreductase [Mycolicibacterium celeriflavum]MCV7239679.1 NAD(P)/FAD-dependent oxidoreductase [Mycolicibacterium celeriflavum]OBG18219.1 FAD-dependent oxidoreductase [Mycolicibacterium celeriflavum]ORA43902.1 FAD-dependent oxidoreductase [Mycolicibacterium celeriflavum]BBY43648.1 monooxygenase flavin-binding family protein [Mycolicibacterium celeriflavum]